MTGRYSAFMYFLSLVYIQIMGKRACLARSCLRAATFVSVIGCIAGVDVERAFVL